MKKAIAMRCTQEQFEAIKPRLKENNIEIVDISSNFTRYCYLVNNFKSIQNKIANVGTEDYKNSNREVLETWNEKVFLEACGIVVVPTLEEVYKYFENAKTIRVGNVEFERKGDIYFSSGSFYQTENRYCMWHPFNGYSLIVEAKKPIRTNKLTELEKRVEVLEMINKLGQVASGTEKPINIPCGVESILRRDGSSIPILKAPLYFDFDLGPVHSPEKEMQWRVENEGIKVPQSLKDDLKNGTLKMGYESNDIKSFRKNNEKDIKSISSHAHDAFIKAIKEGKIQLPKTVDVIEELKNYKPNHRPLGFGYDFGIQQFFKDSQKDLKTHTEIIGLKMKNEELEAEIKHILAGGKSKWEKEIEFLKKFNTEAIADCNYMLSILKASLHPTMYNAVLKQMNMK